MLPSNNKLMLFFRCHACDELIFSSKFALAGNKSYHKEHLLCFACDCSLEDAKGYTKSGELYCANCYETKFCTDCMKCQKKINVESRHVSFRVSRIDINFFYFLFIQLQHEGDKESCFSPISIYSIINDIKNIEQYFYLKISSHDAKGRK